MPGYRALADTISGSVADRVREAEALEREHDMVGALRRYEEALAEQMTYRGEMPAFLCGRLATLYRRLGLYDEEVALLERYRDSQTTDEARSRFQARLSKAQIVADKRRRQESGALASIRAVRENRSGRGRRGRRTSGTTESADAGRELVQALRRADTESPLPTLTGAVTRFCASVEITNGVEDLVGALKSLLGGIAPPSELESAQWDARCSLALELCIASYFEAKAS
jgi:hypothetical protein